MTQRAPQRRARGVLSINEGNLDYVITQDAQLPRQLPLRS
jgi:hypothetical protein